MGRKEKIVNVSVTTSTTTTPAHTSIISKRTYTRQVSNKAANASAESSSSEAVSDVMDEIINKKSNNDADIQCKDVANGRIAANAKTKRRSNVGKVIVDTGSDVHETTTTTTTTAASAVAATTTSLQPQNTVSSIAQRPRRQVKHKFIKSANINVIDKTTAAENSVQNTDVNDVNEQSESTESLTLLNSLSPNNKVRLVPLVHRLPMNTSKLNWQNVIHHIGSDANESGDTIDTIETTEIQSDSDGDGDGDGDANNDNEPATSIIKEMKTERHKKLSNTKQAIRRGRQLRQTVCPVEPIESNHATEVSNDETEDSVNESTVTDSGMTSAFDDEEDDIMIVEEKDALNVPDHVDCVAEEIIYDETVDDADFADVEYLSSSQNTADDLSQNSSNDVDQNEASTSNGPHDNTTNQQASIEADLSEGVNNQNEPIYLSDSLSCFDSDSDTQESEMQSSSVTVKTNSNSIEVKCISEPTNMADETDEIERLNESMDDVIIVPAEYVEPIEIDQSDSDEERFAKKFSFEALVDSDSQPIEMNSTTKADESDNAFKKRYESVCLDETTTDADDDSSEVEKRSTRSRRDNVARKNYSIRRTYARRKLQSESESPISNEQHNQSNTEDGSINDVITVDTANVSANIGNEHKLRLIQDSNTTDGTGTDEENQLSMMRTKSIRTYVRRKASISKLAACQNDDTTNASKEIDKIESDSQSENTTSSSNDTEIKPNTNVVMSPAPRKRGRPRKKPFVINGIEVSTGKSSEQDIRLVTNTEPKAQTIETQIQTNNINEIAEHEQLIDDEPIELSVSSANNPEFSSNYNQNENDAMDKSSNNAAEQIQNETTLEKSSSDVQKHREIDENMDIDTNVEENISQSEKHQQEIGQNIITVDDDMDIDCNENEHTTEANISTVAEENQATNNECKRSSHEIIKASTKSASRESFSVQALDIKTETVMVDDALSKDLNELNEKSTKEKPMIKEEVPQTTNQLQVITKQSNEESPDFENVGIESDELMVMDSPVEKPTIASKSSNQQQVKLEQPTVEEPAVESISVKIEQIAIDTEARVILPSKQSQNISDAQLVDIKPDIKPIKLQSAEKVTSKSDEVKTQKEEFQSALVGLPKDVIAEIEDTSIRRSGRIRTINKTKQRAQGFGLVKDKKRAPVIVDEDSSSAGFDASTDNIQDKDASQTGTETKVRIKTEEELEKEKVDREKGMKLFVPIIDNEYRSERTISKEAKKMTCDCFLTQFEIERGELGCGDDCLNRMLLIECSPKCIVGDRCTNRRFQKHENSACNIFKTEKKGYGLIATSFIPAGQFIMEYVGEVLNSKQFEKRANDYSKQMNAHYYFMALSSDCVIDATKKGNISRFINHSCDPNAETQKWTVNGELRIGFFSKKAISPDEEITFDYQFQRYGKEAQKCYCESMKCRGWIGGEPESEEELESDDDEEGEDDASISKDDNESVSTVAADGVAKKKVKLPKPKKPKDATKKPMRKERAKANRKTATDFNKHMTKAEIMEDPDLDKEIDALATGGLKNQVQTLQFSRLMVRAKLQKAKLRLLSLLREGELPCRRLFLDYHGLKLMHSWMSDVNSADRMLSLTFRLEILQTLENLPITNKTTLQDSKVLSTVQRWSTVNEYSFLLNDPQPAINNDKTANATADESPSDSGSGTPILNDETASPKGDETATSNAPLTNDNASIEMVKDVKETKEATNETSNTNSSTSSVKQSDVLDAIPQILEQNSTIKGMGVDLLKSIISTTEKNTKIIEDSEKLPDGEMGKLVRDICLLASKLVTTWEQLPESYKIPKKSRIEQMKQHEREADESYKENVEEKTPTAIATPKTQTFSSSGWFSERTIKAADSTDSREKDPRDKDPRYRRSYNSELKKQQRRQMFEAKVAQEDAERKKMMENMIHEARCAFFHLDPRMTREFMVPTCVNPATGQWYGDKMIKVPTPPSHAHIKPPPVPLPTDINEYMIPPIDLPEMWKFAINEKGQIYYYHTKILIPQWEPPIKLLPLMEEHRINDIDLKVEAIDTPLHSTDDEHEIEHDVDDEDEDVVSILSNSTMNANCLLELKSDPILEKYNDDDSSSTDSDDSLLNELAELEAKYSFIKKKTDDYWMNMKRPPNLNEEIAAMAKLDSTGMPSTMSLENTRAREEEKQANAVSKANSTDAKRKRKKSRAALVQTIRISPLSDEMKRELRRDSRRYKENKAKLRRQKELLLKRKNEMKSSHPDGPVRKLKKITEGLPQVPKHLVESESHNPIDNHAFSVSSFSTSRYNNENIDSKRAKPSAFASLSSGGLSISSSTSSTSALNSSLGSLDTPTRALQSARNSLPSTSLTQSIVNKLPSIGHKFVGDTEELIMKNTIKPIKPAEPVPVPVTTPVVNTIRSTPTQLSSQQQQQQQLVKKAPHSILNPAKSSPKPMMKKKKTTESNECLDVNSPAARKIKEKFKSDISGDIVRHLKPYFSKTCTVGQIQSSDDFRHLARKLTFFVMLKELKYCNNVSLLEVTDSVKNKAREYIKKYMSKFGKTYIRDENEKDYHFEDL